MSRSRSSSPAPDDNEGRIVLDILDPIMFAPLASSNQEERYVPNLKLDTSEAALERKDPNQNWNLTCRRNLMQAQSHISTNTVTPPEDENSEKISTPAVLNTSRPTLLRRISAQSNLATAATAADSSDDSDSDDEKQVSRPPALDTRPSDQGNLTTAAPSTDSSNDSDSDDENNVRTPPALNIRPSALHTAFVNRAVQSILTKAAAAPDTGSAAQDVLDSYPESPIATSSDSTDSDVSSPFREETRSQPLPAVQRLHHERSASVTTPTTASNQPRFFAGSSQPKPVPRVNLDVIEASITPAPSP